MHFCYHSSLDFRRYLANKKERKVRNANVLTRLSDKHYRLFESHRGFVDKPCWRGNDPHFNATENSRVRVRVCCCEGNKNRQRADVINLRLKSIILGRSALARKNRALNYSDVYVEYKSSTDKVC